MRKIYLIDNIYTGHHVSYAKGLIRSTNKTILLVNENKLNLYEDVPINRIKTIRCKDPRSFKFAIIGWFINFFHLLVDSEIRGKKIHFLYSDNIIIFLWLYSTLNRKGSLFLTIHWANAVVPIKKTGKLRSVYRIIKFNAFKKLATKTKAIFVHGQRTYSQLKKRYNLSNVITIPYGTELEKGRNDEFVKGREPRVLFFGGIRKDKGIKKLAEVVERCSDIEFTIAGKPEDYTLEEIKKLFGKCTNIELKLDFILDQDVPALFLQADLLILPYEYYFSGQSGPMTLAAKYGIPIVATNVGDMGYDINKYRLGETVLKNDPDLLENSLRKVLLNKEDYILNLKKYYYASDWSKVGSIIEGYYDENEVLR
jgi:glycosyltransferase involved in cell wall biosynthesis